MADNLVQAETQRHNLVADVAHELRTPLTVIRANLEGMMDDILPLDMGHIQTVYAETLLLNRLVDDLRLLSLAEAGELKLECGWSDPGHLINQVLERSAARALQKQIKFEVNIQANLAPVWIDADRITQVLNNLITNAMRYTSQNGVITVSAAPVPDQPDFIQIMVDDTGAGIPADTLPYIFERFYRADKSRARSSGGSGLGLTIVKQLVEMHGGEVNAESPIFTNENQQGYGTRISFTVPVIKLKE